jgi:hypothetical protein
MGGWRGGELVSGLLLFSGICFMIRSNRGLYICVCLVRL